MSEDINYRAAYITGPAAGMVVRYLRQIGVKIDTAQAWITARERAMQLNNLLETALNSTVLIGLNQDNAHSLGEIGIAKSMLEAFCGVETFRSVAEQLHGKDFHDLKDEIGNLSSMINMDSSLENLHHFSLHLQKRIENLASRVQKTLCEVEKDAIQGTAVFALNSLGYIVEQKGDAIKATRGTTCIWIEASPWADLQVDYSGFSGTTCLKEIQRVEDQFRRSGLVLKRTESQFHGSPEGGQTTKKLDSVFPVFRKPAVDICVPYKNQQKITLEVKR
jgi:hypothetical protein